MKEYKEWWDWQKDMISRTQTELDQIRKGLLDYEASYGSLPSVSDYHDLLPILQGANPNKTTFIICDPWELDAKGELIDAWGTRLRISLDDPKNPQAQSAGLDKRWNSADDLSAAQTP